MGKILATLMIWLSSAAAADNAVLPPILSTDRAAWETFATLVAPANMSGGTMPEFETWASDEDVYLTDPPTWPRPDGLRKPGSGGASAPCARPPGSRIGGFPVTACIKEDVRHNRPSFSYIVDKGLYTRAGLASAARNGLVVDFPSASVAIKADWMRVKDLEAWQHYRIPLNSIRQLYYTKMISEHSIVVEYALLSIHVSTKQTKNWFWSDIEHELNPGRCDDVGCHDSFGAVLANVAARNTRSLQGNAVGGNQSYGQCNKSPAAETMLANVGAAAVWRHYCLKGTQSDFVNADGSNSVLGNSVIERINSDVPVSKSSCITCHAYAAFNPSGVANGAPHEPVGRFDVQSLNGMTRNDFMWSLSKAR